jgi:hypothetical protein
MLHDQYLEWCKTFKLQHPLSPELFGRAMKKLVPTIGTVKITKHSIPGGLRVSCFKLPSLPECRKYLQDAMKADDQIWL